MNAKLVEAGGTPINLTSIMIGAFVFRSLRLRRAHDAQISFAYPGNGCTDWSTMIPSYYDMQCQPMTVEPVTPIR